MSSFRDDDDDDDMSVSSSESIEVTLLAPSHVVAVPVVPSVVKAPFAARRPVGLLLGPDDDDVDAPLPPTPPATAVRPAVATDTRVAQSFIVHSTRSAAAPGDRQEFAGDSFYDTDDYVNARSARASENVEPVDGGEPAPPPPELDEEQFDVYVPPSAAEQFKGDYAAISLVTDDVAGGAPVVAANAVPLEAAASDEAPLTRSQYARLYTDSEASDYARLSAVADAAGLRQNYGTLPTPVGGGGGGGGGVGDGGRVGRYQRLLDDDEIEQAAGKKPLMYAKLPHEGELRHSTSESAIVRNRKQMDTMERQARANYAALPTKDDMERFRRSRTDSDEREQKSSADEQKSAALSTSSPNAFGAAALSGSGSGSSGPTSPVPSAASPIGANGRANRLRRLDRRNLPSISTMKNGEITCEKCRTQAFTEKITTGAGRVMLLCDACLAAFRFEQTRPQMQSYGALPTSALEAQRSDLLSKIARIETTWGSQPKDAPAVLELTRLQQQLTDIEGEVERRKASGATASTADTSEAHARVHLYATPKQAESVVAAGATLRQGMSSPPPPPPPADIAPAPVSVSDELFNERYGTLDLADFQRAKAASAATGGSMPKKNKTYIVKPDATKQFAPSASQLAISLRASAAPASKTAATAAAASPRQNPPASVRPPSPRRVEPAAATATVRPPSPRRVEPAAVPAPAPPSSGQATATVRPPSPRRAEPAAAARPLAASAVYVRPQARAEPSSAAGGASAPSAASPTSTPGLPPRSAAAPVYQALTLSSAPVQAPYAVLNLAASDKPMF
jgi:hypothetical protein